MWLSVINHSQCRQPSLQVHVSAEPLIFYIKAPPLTWLNDGYTDRKHFLSISNKWTLFTGPGRSIKLGSTHTFRLRGLMSFTAFTALP